MRRISLRLLAGCLVLMTLPLAAAPTAAPVKPALSVVTDREEAMYRAGETVEFRIALTSEKKAFAGATVKYVLSLDGYGTISEGEVTTGEEPAVVRGSLDQPGFLRCTVSVKDADGKVVTALAAAAVDPLEIKPSLPVPEDFDEFWKAQKSQLAAVPLNPQLTPVKSPNPEVECFDVQVGCLGERPVSGYFARPAGAQPKSLPAVLFVHGAGVRSSILGTAVKQAERGRLGMDINAHGIPNGKPSEYYQELSNGELKDYRFAGRESREKSYFLGMYLRLVRAIDFLTSQPEWDGKTVIVTGHSQGGGQSLVAAGLDPRVTAIASGVPAMCDHSGNAANRIAGWPKLVPLTGDGKPDPQVLEASRYFDAMNFATRTKAESLLSVGFIDITCPPTGIYATYNNLPGTKRMLTRPRMGHAAPPDIQEEFAKFIDDHIARQSQAATK